MKKINWLTVLISCLLSLLVVSFINNKSNQEKENVYQRVVRTGKIRCAYWNWPPAFAIDPQTGEKSGIFYDYMQELGKLLDLEIEWVSEEGYGSYITGLETGKYDGMCAGVWPTSTVIKRLDFTTPIFYVPFIAYAKYGDTRFDNNIEIANNKDYKISAIDGLVTMRLANALFPNAEVVSYPQMTPVSDMLLAVASGKADLTFTDKLTVEKFIANNPNQLQEIKMDKPMQMYGNTIGVLKSEVDFVNMINYATEELNNAGVLEKIRNKHQELPNTLIGVETFYESK